MQESFNAKKMQETMQESFNAYVVEPITDCLKKVERWADEEGDPHKEEVDVVGHIEEDSKNETFVEAEDEKKSFSDAASFSSFERLGSVEVYADLEDIAPDTEKSTKGCYLRHIEDSSGSLTANWKQDLVEDAVAFFYPRKKVGEFKYTSKGGVVELVRGVQSKKNAKYYSGWVDYLRAGYEVDGVLKILTEDEGQLFYMDDDNSVFRVLPYQWFELKKARAIAIIPMYKSTFNGVKKSTLSQFEDLANTSNGATWKPLKRYQRH